MYRIENSISDKIFYPGLSWLQGFDVLGFGRGEVCTHKYFLFPGAVYSTPAEND